MKLRRFLSAALAVLVLATLVSVAHAQLNRRRLGVRWRNGAPLLDFSARDLANRQVREALGSGIRKRLVLTVQSFLPGGRTPIATRRFTCSATYDLWEAAYVVRLGRRSEVFGTLQEVVDRCLMVRGLRVGQSSDYDRFRGREIYFAVRAEFNPISRSRCRQFLSSSRRDDPIGPIVVNIVRREICQSERSIDFRSPRARVP